MFQRNPFGKNNLQLIVICALLSGTSITLSAQNVGINTTGTTPNSSSILDLNTGNTYTSPNGKGMLLPNVALASATDATTITLPATSLLVYVPVGSGLTPAGYYFNSGTPGSPVWTLFNTGVSANSWLLTGNAGTTPGTNFMGTTDNNDVVFKRNNVQAGLLNSSSYNTSWGVNALNPASTGTGNTACGFRALSSNTTGFWNTASGWQALSSNTTGAFNTASGEGALDGNTTGTDNTANGLDALDANMIGNYNTANGSSALSGNLAGNYNTASGGLALYSNTTGNDNTASGYNALYSNTTAYSNTASGSGALFSNTTGNYNTAVGYKANLSGNYTDCNAFGSNAAPTASNQSRIGDALQTSIGGQVGWTTFSDKRIKNNIQENVPGLAFINELRPVTYHYDIDKENELLGVKDSGNRDGKYDIEKIQFSGFLAQDVEATAKKIGYNFSGVDKTGKIWGLRYSDFVVPLVKAIQEQQKQIDSLKALLNKVNALQTAKSNPNQDDRLAKAEKEIAQLQKLMYTFTEKADARKN